MPVNALRKSGARMSLQEALERVEKLKRLTQSSNEHEASLAALRLKTFDVNAARAYREEKVTTTPTPSEAVARNDDRPMPILDTLPDVPYETLDEIEAHQPEDKTSVNWDELHGMLLQQARNLGADAIANIQLKGTPSQKILGGTALRYLSSQDIYEIDQAMALENIEEHIKEEAKERRDEDTAPGYG